MFAIAFMVLGILIPELAHRYVPDTFYLEIHSFEVTEVCDDHHHITIDREVKHGFVADAAQELMLVNAESEERIFSSNNVEFFEPGEKVIEYQLTAVPLKDGVYYWQYDLVSQVSRFTQRDFQIKTDPFTVKNGKLVPNS